MKILFYDTETTGTDPSVHGIHELSYALWVDGEIKSQKEVRIRPFMGCVYDPDALQIGGVTVDDVNKGESELIAHRSFTADLSRYVDRFDKKDKVFLCGYNNASFDDKFMRAWFLRNGDKYFGSYFWSSPLDLFVQASFYFMKIRKNFPDFKQGTVAKALGVQVDDSKLHDSTYDLYVLMEIFKKLNPKLA